MPAHTAIPAGEKRNTVTDALLVTPGCKHQQRYGYTCWRTELVLEAHFGQQNEDEGEAPLQPRHHRLQLGQGRRRRGRVLLGLLPGAVPLGAARRGGLLQQGGGPVLQRLVVEVVEVVELLVVVVRGRAREKGSAVRAMGAAFFSGRRRHLDEHLGGGAQD